MKRFIYIFIGTILIFASCTDPGTETAECHNARSKVIEKYQEDIFSHDLSRQLRDSIKNIFPNSGIEVSFDRLTIWDPDYDESKETPIHSIVGDKKMIEFQPYTEFLWEDDNVGYTMSDYMSRNPDKWNPEFRKLIKSLLPKINEQIRSFKKGEKDYTQYVSVLNCAFIKSTVAYDFYQVVYEINVPDYIHKYELWNIYLLPNDTFKMELGASGDSPADLF